jgi:hypothetical protein
MVNMPWLAANALNIPINLHPLPRNPENVISKFGLAKTEPAEDHVNKFMLALRILNVEHEYIV